MCGRVRACAPTQALLSIMKPVKVKGHKTNIFRRDAPGRAAMFILEGHVRLLKPDGNIGQRASKVSNHPTRTNKLRVPDR